VADGTAVTAGHTAAAVGAEEGLGAAAEVAAAAAAGVVRQGRVVDGWGLGFYLPGSNSVVMPVQECSLVVSFCTCICYVHAICLKRNTGTCTTSCQQLLDRYSVSVAQPLSICQRNGSKNASV
jgi:hypothetical protein